MARRCMVVSLPCPFLLPGPRDPRDAMSKARVSAVGAGGRGRSTFVLRST